jgi:signal transduction histidine kinase
MGTATSDRLGGAVAATALVVLGVALVAAAIAHGIRYGTPQVQLALAATPGVMLLLGLVYVLWSSLHATTYRTVARWVFGGLAVFGGVVGAVLQYAPSSTLPTSEVVLQSVFFGGIGAVGGLLVGVKSVQAVDEARRAEEARTSALLFAAERDRLGNLSEVSYDLITVEDREDAVVRLARGLESAFAEATCTVWLVDRIGELAPADEDTPASPGRAGKEAFETGEERVVSTPDGGGRLYVPLDEHGLLAVTLPTERGFDQRTRDLVRVYARTGQSALDRVTQQHELERQNERLEEFASVVSHDLRNPLSVIEGRAELALQTGETDQLEPVLRNVDRMDRLIDDLLTLAREGEEATERRPINVGRLVEDAWGSVDTARATLDQPERLPVVEVDPEQFQRVFENLFRNAVEHGGDDVTVTVSPLAGDDGEVTGFAVTDDGPGIPAEERDAVFERGYTTGGNGLGLAIVDDIVRNHGGTVVVRESEAGGARFEIHDVEPDDPVDRVETVA